MNIYGGKQTKAVSVGGIYIGGGHPIAIQSMCNTDTRDVQATVAQIYALEEAGCEIVRCAVPDMAAADALGDIARKIRLPLVADIHFDYRLALRALDGGIAKLRLNPGNIGGRDKVAQVVKKAKAQGVPIRIGVNGGSLEKDLYDAYGGVTAEALAESAMRHVAILEALDFTDIVISMKASDIPLTVAAYDLLAKRVDYPLHVGITEAGTLYRGTIKSAAGIGAVLSHGIGDTIRVSLTDDPVEEVRCAKALLSAMGLRRFGAEIISCPTCGRTEIDLIALAKAVEEKCAHIDKPIRVAVMGCVVNGPGEARDADVGIAGGKGRGVLFKHGEAVRTVPEAELLDALMQEIEKNIGTEHMHG